MVFIEISKHFSYWLLVWYVVYAALGHKTVPSPFWWLVGAAIANGLIVIYTLRLVAVGQVSWSGDVWKAIVIFMLINTVLKLIPLITLRMSWVGQFGSGDTKMEMLVGGVLVLLYGSYIMVLSTKRGGLGFASVVSKGLLAFDFFTLLGRWVRLID